MLGHIRLVLHFTAAVSGHEANTVASKTIIKKTHTHHTNAPNRCERIAFPISPVTGALIVPFGNDPVAVERFMTFTGLRADRPSSRPKGLAGKGECVQKWRTVTRWLGCFFLCACTFVIVVLSRKLRLLQFPILGCTLLFSLVRANVYRHYRERRGR